VVELVWFAVVAAVVGLVEQPVDVELLRFEQLVPVPVAVDARLARHNILEIEIDISSLFRKCSYLARLDDVVQILFVHVVVVVPAERLVEIVVLRH